MSNKKSKWEYFVDVLVVLTAAGMVFLIVFAMLQSAERQGQINRQLNTNNKVLSLVEALVQGSSDVVEEHRESALQQHCAIAYLLALEGGMDSEEQTLVNLSCSQSDRARPLDPNGGERGASSPQVPGEKGDDSSR